MKRTQLIGNNTEDPAPWAVRRVLPVLLLLGLSRPLPAEQTNGGADWPMWRHDAARSAATSHSLPARLHLQWVRRMRRPAPAWPEEQYKLRFDLSYEPVVMGKLIFVPSMVGDKVTAYDTDTGRQVWRFYCDGPVRFAPVAWKDRIFFVSDDGHLYCLMAADGRLVWKIRLGPSDARILGNGRLISTWPARGAPVLLDDRIYCAAGIWPFMGVFIYAIDAETGATVWENTGGGSTYMTQQHNSPAFGAVAPQGYLAATGDRLLIPSRTTPACYDRRTGRLIYYRLSNRGMGKHVGGYNVYVWKDLFFNNSIMYRLRDGEGIVKTAVQVPAEDAIVAFDKDGRIVAYLPEKVPPAQKAKNEPEIKAKALWKAEFGAAVDKIHIRAGARLYGSNSRGNIAAIDTGTPGQGDTKTRISWSYRIKGSVWNMLAADDKLFVVTEDGLLYCFGGDEVETKWHGLGDRLSLQVPRKARRTAKRILEAAGAKQGYCLLLGAGNGGLAKAILAESDFHIIAVEPDLRAVASLRQEMDEAGAYGQRISILPGDISTLQLPPYLASLIVAEDSVPRGLDRSVEYVQKVYHSLRPYGGTAWLTAGRRARAAARRIASLDLPGSRIEAMTAAVVLRREGPLPGSGDWIGQYGDPANTVVSKDDLRAPLGLLWFGDDSEFTDVLPRHGHGPPEQVVGGRLFIEGIDSISARDVYTGRALWKKKLKSPETFGLYYDGSYKGNHRDLSYNQLHIPGANTRGTNFVATRDKLYIIDAAKCLVLDAATGVQLDLFTLPDREGKPAASWAYIGVYGDYLLAGADFVAYLDLLAGNNKKLDGSARFFDKYASKRLVVMDRHTGRVRWTADANIGFIHNCIAAGQGRIFLLDGLPPYLAKVMAERNIEINSTARIISLDVRDGSVVWEKTDGVFGSWLGYSEQYDILLQGYRKSRDMVPEPGDRMATWRGTTGRPLWDRAIEYSGPCMLHGEKIITQEAAYDLLTGERIMREHPLTGEPVEWGYARNYGCNTVIAARNLLTFRSAAAGYFNLANDGGTGNFGGFKSGCTSNLIVANGVLNAPEYTRTCTCSYQNQTSLALVHMPQVETWTFNRIKAGNWPIRRLGVNFGAPGDRKAANGTLWLDYPSVGGPSPPVKIAVAPKKPQWFRSHSSRIRKGVLEWVEASGAKGITSISIKLDAGGRRTRESGASEPDPLADCRQGRYTVRLHFAEPDAISEGQRVFDVALQGDTVLKNFDIVKEAGAPGIGIVREFSCVRAPDNLDITLHSKVEGVETVICGIEVIAELPARPIE
ncbi:MAG: PQQ-binding-like beta-propeller repeat protein [Phycisphaerales bacterium]|nr:MAG: PQQ-binding-like beta-propeller repeat protein [Phycisphaerales bacterium]